MRRFFPFLIFLFLAACGVNNATASPTPSVMVSLAALPATATLTPASLPSATPSITPSPTLSPDAWQSMPVIPTSLSSQVRAIYQRGLELGNHPEAFSKIGDCDSAPSWFLGGFDRGTRYYSLGEYAYLQAVIDHFQGSFERSSQAVGRGFTGASVLTSLWADPKQCQPGEIPLVCELRLHQPVYALVMLGTNDVNHQDSFEENMRRILDLLIEQGVVPILATKADNLEGDHAINAVIARLAYEYQLPLWNFWLAVQPLPARGLQEDGAHLTWASNFFDNPLNLEKAWPQRNLTALQVLDFVWRSLTAPRP